MDTKTYMRKWREAHKDYHKTWRENNPGKDKEYAKKSEASRKSYRLKHKEHYRKYGKEWRRNNAEKIKQYTEEGKTQRANGHLQKKFGITIDEYNRLLEYQDHRCAICKRHKDEFKRSLHVDHVHDNNKKIRGLLCVNCNKMLGHAKDNVENLKSGVAYLEALKKITVDKFCISAYSPHHERRNDCSTHHHDHRNPRVSCQSQVPTYLRLQVQKVCPCLGSLQPRTPTCQDVHPCQRRLLGCL